VVSLLSVPVILSFLDLGVSIIEPSSGSFILH